MYVQNVLVLMENSHFLCVDFANTIILKTNKEFLSLCYFHTVEISINLIKRVHLLVEHIYTHTGRYFVFCKLSDLQEQ